MALTNTRLQEKYAKCETAFATVQEALVELSLARENAQKLQRDPEKAYKAYRDSLIQRFEYTFDLTWKYLAEYLQAEGRKLDVISPKATFREAFKAGMLSEDAVRTAIAMVDHRNLTTHGYNEKLIEDITSYVPAYVRIFEHILTFKPVSKK